MRHPFCIKLQTSDTQVLIFIYLFLLIASASTISYTSNFNRSNNILYTFSTFSSVVADLGHPLRGSSWREVRPRLNLIKLNYYLFSLFKMKVQASTLKSCTKFNHFKLTIALVQNFIDSNAISVHDEDFSF